MTNNVGSKDEEELFRKLVFLPAAFRYFWKPNNAILKSVRVQLDVASV